MNIVIDTLILLSQGVPGIVVAGLAVILMLFGLIRKDSGTMVTSALLTILVTYLAGGWAGMLLVVRLLPLFSLLSAFAISRDEMLLAWILPLPSLGYLVYFLFSIVVSDFGAV
jgi:hypothetical protein